MRPSILDTRVRRGRDMNSDHRLVVTPAEVDEKDSEPEKKVVL